tara:strand:+ start:311 stop:1018 length:708 start_codon:yes stop_codon:yes gene_type:complete
MTVNPKVYLILGFDDSGRRAIITDFIDCLGSQSPILYFRHKDEAKSNWDSSLEELAQVGTISWSVEDTKIKHDSITESPSSIFFLAPSNIDLADVMEALKGWLSKNDCELTRIITVVDCKSLSENDAMNSWYDAAIHFSDMVLLNRRENVGEKWIKDFVSNKKKQFHPTRFELVKKNRVNNPIDVLDSQAYRTSLYFDDLIPIEEDEFEDLLPEDKKIDPYIERLESGKRRKPVS